jgi:hypothetical protein
MYGIQAWMQWFSSHTKTSCWRNAPSLGLPATPSQIVHFQWPSAHPMFHYAKKNLLLAFLVCWRQIINLVPFLVSHVKGLLHLQDINLESRPHSRHGNHPTQWNNHTALRFGEILYFSTVYPLLIFVRFCTTQIVLSNDKWSSSIWFVKVENC